MIGYLNALNLEGKRNELKLKLIGKVTSIHLARVQGCLGCGVDHVHFLSVFRYDYRVVLFFDPSQSLSGLV